MSYLVGGFLDDMAAEAKAAAAKLAAGAKQAGSQIQQQVNRPRPQGAPKQKSWEDAANEIKAALELAQRTAQLEGMGAVNAFKAYAVLVDSYLNGDLTMLLRASLAGDQLDSYSSLKPRIRDIKDKMQVMAEDASNGKMTPPSGGGYSPSQIATQLSSQLSTLAASRPGGMNPAVLVGGGLLLGLVALKMLKKSKKAAA